MATIYNTLKQFTSLGLIREIVVDQNSGSTLKGRGSGDILMETNTDGEFNKYFSINQK